MRATFGDKGALKYSQGRSAGRLRSALGAPVKAAADDPFHDPVVGGRGGAYAYSKIDLPLRRHVQIDGRKNLLLLIVQAGDIRDAAVIRVVLDSAADQDRKVVADLDRRRKIHAEIDQK